MFSYYVTHPGAIVAETTTLTIRISPETKARLEKLAQKHGRSKSYLALQALERYLAEEELMTWRIRKGLKAADEGDFATSQEVEAVFRRSGA
jgi:RHH-type transcriptional regulator, rel operon repressor / antitoxin RelB